LRLLWIAGLRSRYTIAPKSAKKSTKKPMIAGYCAGA
jgi:hypothetical protein